MRTWLLIALIAPAACGNKSKLDVVPGGETDALWDLAPDQLEVGVVASPRALGFAMRGLAAAEKLVATSDFAPLRPRVEAVTAALLGRPGATFADAGFATDRGFALFVTNDGVIAVMPVVDRAKFMAAKHGTLAGAGSGSGDLDDHLEGSTCRPIRDVYACATGEAMFGRVGKGPLRGKLELAGGRGDVEVYAPQLPLFGGTPGDLAVAIVLDDGEVGVRGRWTGAPGGMLGELTSVVAPHPNTAGASSFLALDIAKLLDGIPALPLAGTVTLAELAATIKGPVTATIPSNTVDIQVHVPLSDPAPAKTAIENCDALKMYLDLTAKQQPGRCRFRMQGDTNPVELDMWVDADAAELRLGANKDAPPTLGPSALTPIGRELATGDWSAAFWGRGTMLNLPGVGSAGELTAEGAATLHAFALIDEAGAAIKVDKNGVTLRAALRTVWTNPPALIAKLVAISGNDIASGKAGEVSKALAAANPDTPFAADFAAGQGGLLIPGAILGTFVALTAPAVSALLGGVDDPSGQMPEPGEPDDP